MKISLARSGLVLDWDPDAKNLLEFIEDQDIFPDNSCRGGMCRTCMTKLLSGTVVYVIDPAVQVDEGHVLLCSSRPDGDISLDI